MCLTAFERRRTAPFLVDKHVSVTNSTDAGCARNLAIQRVRGMARFRPTLVGGRGRGGRAR